MSFVEDYTPDMSFQDREHAFGILDKILKTLGSDQPNLLVFHGVSGIGKSALCNRLETELTRHSSPRILIGKLVFRDTGPFAPEVALAQLRLDLGRRGRIVFPAFDIGYLSYLKQAYPERPLQSIVDWLGRSGSVLEELVEAIPEGISSAANGATEIPGVGFFVELGKLVIAKGHSMWAHRARTTLQLIYDVKGNLRSAEEIRALLPNLLAQDLTAHMGSQDSQQIVLLLDEYERLWPGEPAGRRNHPVDDALELLARKSDGLLFIFFSRYPLHWGSRQRAWRRILSDRQHLLGGLPPSSAEAILEEESIPIAEPEIRKAIIESVREADGSIYPFFLELQIKHYVELKREKEKTLSPEDFRVDSVEFNGRRLELVRRFLRDYESDIEASLKYLAVPQWFDGELALALHQEFGIGGLSVLERIGKFSFVEKSSNGQYRFIPHIWREAIVEDLEYEIKGKIHEFLFRHFDKRAMAQSHHDISESHCLALKEASHHLVTNSPEKFQQWRKERLPIYYEACRYDAIRPVVEQAVRLAELTETPGTHACVKPAFELAQVLSILGRWADAERVFKEIIVNLEGADIESEEGRLLAAALVNLASLKIDMKSDLGNVDKLLYQAEALAFGDGKPLVHPLDAAFLRRVQADLATERDSYFQAEKYRRQSLEYCKEAVGWEHLSTQTALHELGKTLENLGRLNEAEALLSKTTEWYRKEYGDDHLFTRTALANLAKILRLQGRSHSALVVIEGAVKNLESLPTLQANPRRTYWQLEHAKILRDSKRFDQAESYFRMELDAKSSLLEEGNYQQREVMADLATVLTQCGKHEEAERLFRKVVDYFDQQEKVPLSLVGRVKNRFGELLIEQGKFEEALPVLFAATNSFMKAYGLDHYRVARATQNIIRAREELGSTFVYDWSEIRVAEIYRASSFEIRLKYRDWSPVESDNLQWLKEKIAPPMLTIAEMGDVIVEKAGLSDLYTTDTELLRFTFLGTAPLARQFAIKSQDFFVQVDGTAAPFHALNRKVQLALAEPQIIAYLWLYNELLLLGVGCKILLCEREEDIDWRHDASDEVKEQVSTHLFSPQLSVNVLANDSKQRWSVRASLLIANELVHATFLVCEDGSVEMLEAETVLSNLPVASFMRGLRSPTSSKFANKFLGDVRIGNRSWERLSGSEADLVCQTLGESITGFSRSKGFNFEFADLSDFYRLPCAIYRFRTNEEKTSWIYAIGRGAKMQVLDGTGAGLIIKSAELGLELDNENVVDYLSLFCEVLVSHGGRFQVCNNVGDIPWAHDAPLEEMEQARKLVEKPRLTGQEESGAFLLKAYVLYQDVLFYCDFRVLQNGAVEMISDEPKIGDLHLETKE